MTELTERQRAILAFIAKTAGERGYPPSVREIGDAVGLQSPSSVHAQLRTLAERGHLRKDPTRPRALRVTMPTLAPEHRALQDVPLVGSIAAGSPLLADENIESVLPLPREVVGAGTLFALRVKGDSMTGAGIFDGDLIVVRQQPDAQDGEIVAALVGGDEATVKYLRRDGETVVLEAANPAFQPMQPEDVAVLGKVVAVFRRL